MKHERMKVLEMLDEGKITAEEAAKLLEAMKSSGGSSHTFVFDDEAEKDMDEKLGRFTQGVDNFTREFGGRIESLYKDIEPKVRKASQSVLEKTAAVFDEISKSLNESLENARRTVDEAAECKDNCQDECCCNSPEEKPEDKAPGEN